MGQKIYVNGKFLLRENAKVSVFDHGLLYGDGVFEGIRAYGGNVFKLTEHVKRLYRSAKAILLKIPVLREEMENIILQTLQKNGISDGYIRILVTRGEGDLGLDPAKCQRPSIIVIADKIKLYADKVMKSGIELVTVSTRRNLPAIVDPRIKSLNYLNNIMAKIQAVNAGVTEALFITAEGYVTECTGDNVFIVSEGILKTPPAYVGILEGITRACVIKLAKESGKQVMEEIFTQYDIYNADECFLTGTAAEVVPVSKVDGRKIGNGKPGPVTLSLMEEFRSLALTDGTPIR